MSNAISETITEQLTRSEMNFIVGDNDFGVVLAQNYTGNFSDIETALKMSGGKPKICELDDYETRGAKQGKPEYIITFKNEPNLIIVIECKASTSKHSSNTLSEPNKYAVDGVLYYAKYLKEYYNVIAVAISGTKKENSCVSHYFWQKKQSKYVEFEKQRNFFIEPENYLRLYKGEKIQKNYSLEEIKDTAICIHESLRKNGVENATKPVFIAGLLIALSDKEFEDNFNDIRSFSLLKSGVSNSINTVLNDAGVDKDKTKMIINSFEQVTSIDNFRNTPLGEDNSLLWYLKQLDQKIIPMMNYSESTLDALGVFYHEFIKYSGSDGKSLGIVLTPQHLTEFMAELVEVNKNSKVVDICCGTGSFLVTSMGIMHQNASIDEWEKIRKENLYGVEKSPNHHLLALTNMIIRKDGKSNIFYGSCFDKQISKKLKDAKINIGLINPPYALKGGPCELEFVEQMLEILVPNGLAAAVVPMSCAIGTKFKEVRKRLFEKHTLKAVFSMPSEIFAGQKVSTNVCVMLWEAHKKHDKQKNTFFGYYKEDGFVKAKKLGRIDKFNKWKNIKNEWLQSYQDRIVKEGFSCLKSVDCNDEWLCEAYMKTDYSSISDSDFKDTIKKYSVFLLANDLKDNIYSDKLIQEVKNLNKKEWKEFNYTELFDIKGSKTTPLTDLEIIGKGVFPYVTTQAVNNGVEAFFNHCTEKENVLTVDSAVLGYCAYQEKAFSASDHVEKLIPKFSFNQYIAMFLVTLINKEQYRYNYGRKCSQKQLKLSKIKLPINEKGTPDWQFMEDYIKSLPYSINL